MKPISGPQSRQNRSSALCGKDLFKSFGTFCDGVRYFEAECPAWKVLRLLAVRISFMHLDQITFAHSSRLCNSKFLETEIDFASKLGTLLRPSCTYPS